MGSVAYERRVNLPAEKLCSLLVDYPMAPTPDIKVELLSEGDPEANWVGATRLMTIGKDTIKQVLVESNLPQSYAYRIVDHPLIKDYYARIDLTEEGGSTLMRYQAEFKPAIPLTGGIVCAKVKSGLVELFDSIDKHYCRGE